MQNIFSDFSKRVEYIIDTYYEGNKSNFADENDISRQYVNKWERQDKGEAEGKPNPSMKKLLNIISNTGVNPTWLVLGKGDPDNPTLDSLSDLDNERTVLLGDLRKSDIPADEKYEFLVKHLRYLLDLIED